MDADDRVECSGRLEAGGEGQVLSEGRQVPFRLDTVYECQRELGSPFVSPSHTVE